MSKISKTSKISQLTVPSSLRSRVELKPEELPEKQEIQKPGNKILKICFVCLKYKTDICNLAESDASSNN
jgi:hypothetical protein